MSPFSGNIYVTSGRSRIPYILYISFQNNIASVYDGFFLIWFTLDLVYGYEKVKSSIWQFHIPIMWFGQVGL